MASEPDNLDETGARHPPGAVMIKVFSSAAAAETAAALLEANHLTCWLHADDCGGMLSALDAAHGVKLLVPLADADGARALLSAEPAATGAQIAEGGCLPGEDPNSPSPRLKLSLPQIMAGIVVGALLCLLYQWTTKLGTKTYRFDTNQDGKTDSVWVYRNGECVEIDEDRNFDGLLDSWSSFERGSRRVSAKADNNFDGEPDVWWNYTNGLLAVSRADTDFNGTADMTNFFKNEQVTRSDWQPNGTNVITLRQFFQHGILVAESRDTNWDGTFDITVQFDAFENAVNTNALTTTSSAQ